MAQSRVLFVSGDTQFASETARQLEANLDTVVDTLTTATAVLDSVERERVGTLILTEGGLDTDLGSLVETVSTRLPTLPIILLYESGLATVTEMVDLDHLVDIRSKASVADDSRCLLPILRRVIETQRPDEITSDAGEPTASVQARYQRLVEQRLVGIYTIEDRTFTYVNDTLADIFGTTPEAMVGTSVFEYVADEHEKLVRKRLHERETGETSSSHYTFHGVHPERDTVVVEAHGSRIDTPDGVSITGTMLDITDRDSYERELRRLSQALEYAGTGIYITDTDSVIQYVNPSFERITGYDKAEAIGATPKILNSGQMDDDYFRRLYQTLEADDVWEDSIVDQRKNGELYHAHQTITPYKSPDGETEGYVAVHSDITEARIQQQVVQVFQRIFRHNLRNKLTVIRGQLELLREDVEGTSAHAYLDDIGDAVAVLDSLSEKATAVTTALESTDESYTIDIVDIFRREIETVQSHYPDVSVTLDAPDTVHVEGGGELEVVVNELLTNAVVHCDHDDPAISIRLTTDIAHSMAKIEIRDNGPGITDNELSTLEAGEETPLVHASGIGLWLVKWVTTDLGGDVTFENVTPRGLAVTLSLPLA